MRQEPEQAAVQEKEAPEAGYAADYISENEKPMSIIGMAMNARIMQENPEYAPEPREELPDENPIFSQDSRPFTRPSGPIREKTTFEQLFKDENAAARNRKGTPKPAGINLKKEVSNEL